MLDYSHAVHFNKIEYELDYNTDCLYWSERYDVYYDVHCRYVRCDSRRLKRYYDLCVKVFDKCYVIYGDDKDKFFVLTKDS